MSRTPSALLLAGLLAGLPAGLLVLPTTLAAQQGNGLTVRSDPRVELLAIVFRLAGNPEYAGGLVPSFARALQEHFAPHREHPAVLEAKRLREQYGVSFDAVMSMAIHVDGVQAPQPRRAFTEPDPSLERRWKAAEAQAFVDRLRAFVRDAGFAEFLAANRPALDSARVRMERVVRADIDVAWLTAFFGRQPAGEFIMAPLLTAGAGNYGPRYLDGEREEVYAIIGTRADSTGHPAFDARFVPTMVHEFSHSFVNPAVVRAQERFRAAGQAIYPAVAQEMRSQAYSNWQTMINESLVRAAVARYVLAKSGEVAARAEVAAQRARGFLWTHELFELLGEYERARARYPTLDSFLPPVAEYFDGLVPRLAAMVRAYDESRPKLVSVAPANDAVGVDPALDRIVIRFDRPMTSGYNINIGAAGREHYPEVTKVEWDDAGTVLTLFVKLKPQWSYELVLGSGFRSRTGVALRSTPVKFVTR